MVKRIKVFGRFVPAMTSASFQRNVKLVKSLYLYKGWNKYTSPGGAPSTNAEIVSICDDILNS